MKPYQNSESYVSRMARAELDDQGWWIITIAGTSVHVAVGRDEDITFEGFPGFAMGHRLIEQGYMPDRSDTREHPSGWRRTGKDAWVIPCYREEMGVMKTKPNSTHYAGCSADEDPDGETMCVCSSIEAEPEPDPREETECQAEFIDGSWYGDDCPECRESVRREMDDCEQCEEEEYCSKHSNGVYG